MFPQGGPVVALLPHPFMAAVTPGVSTVVSFQEFLEDALSAFHGAKPSPELSCAAPGLSVTRWGG